MDYIKGMTWGWTGVRGSWDRESAAFSMNEMTRLGVNWTAISFSALQDHPQATQINFRDPPTVTDREVEIAIKRAQTLGLKVCLKPVVNCKNGVWRAHICFFDHDVPCEPKWRDWFASYREFILHYARIAEKTGCDMFCIGCEMVQAHKREAEWRELIHQVRKVYSGPITYNCDKYQEENVSWWDAVDIISSSGYYPIDSWDERVSELEAFVKQHDKPFFFMEAGCPSRQGSAMLPNDWQLEGGPNLAEQDRYYQVMFDKIGHKPWFHGFMLWDWPAELYAADVASSDNGYNVYQKPAESRIREFYTAR